MAESVPPPADPLLPRAGTAVPVVPVPSAIAQSPFADETALIRQLQISMGAPTLCVELTPEHYEYIFGATRRWFQSFWGGLPKRVLKQYTPGLQTFTMPAECEEVQNVYFTARLPFQFDYPELFAQGVPWPGLYGSSLGAGSFGSSGNMPFSGFYQYFQQLEMGQKILSTDRDYEYTKYNKTLTIHPRMADGGFIVIDFLSNSWCIADLPFAEADLFFRWARAEMKELLGQIRTKFGPWFVPGGERSLNGEALLEQAREEKERLREEIRDRFKPALFFCE